MHATDDNRSFTNKMENKGNVVKTGYIPEKI